MLTQGAPYKVILRLCLSIGSYKVFFFFWLEKKDLELRNVVPTSELQLPKSITNDQSFCFFKVSLAIESNLVLTLAGTLIVETYIF